MREHEAIEQRAGRPLLAGCIHIGLVGREDLRSMFDERVGHPVKRVATLLRARLRQLTRRDARLLRLLQCLTHVPCPLS